MPVVRIDGRQITDWNSFHDVFSRAFGFPDFYGRNMNAWIDCMSYIDDEDAGMTNVFASSSDPMVIQIDNIDGMRRGDREIYDALVECSAFVNWRRIEAGDPAILVLSFSGAS